MRIGVGLPNGVPGTSGQLLIEWAKRADEGPFSSLGVVDRLAYDSYDPLSALAAAAAVTSRLRLATTIVISLLRPTGTLAKAAASLDALSGGRLVLGLAVGARREDFEAAGVDYHERGKRLTEQLIALRTLWEEGVLSPRTEHPSGPPLLVGGLSDAGFARMARYADGYVHGGDFRRPGQPQIWAQGYFAFGDTAIAAGKSYLRDYYAFTGPFAERIAAELLTTPQAIAQFARGYEEAGCDELVLFPTVPDLDQLAQLANVLNGLGRGAL
jgi:alkanesulfonate monooxygenase SsuD/methylene tetrahydromethanopterin reductase-like flavin-dependent oxidoreductase (luciferase family)